MPAIFSGEPLLIYPFPASMDDGMSHPHIVIVVFLASISVVAVILLLAAFVYLLRRRSTRSAMPPKFSGEPRQSPSKLRRLFFLRPKGASSQVEPAGADEVKLPEYCDMDLSPATGDGVVEWREFEQIYGHARQLYTINEEKETETESEHDSFRFVGGSPSPSPALAAVEAVGTETAPATAEEGQDGDGRFFTPCSSPPFYTPSSSPLRAFNVVSDMAGAEEDEATPASRVGFSGRIPFPAYGYTRGQQGGAH